MEELNELRVKLKNRYLLLILFFIVFTIMGIFLLMGYSNAVIGLILSLVCIIVLAIITLKPSKEYKKRFKSEIVKKALEEKFTDLEYDPNKGMPYSVIASTKMMRMGDIYHSEDYISGKYKDIKFEQADVHIEEEYQTTDSEGHTETHYVTIFMGRWMIFDFNKSFKADVQISQKGFGNSKVRKHFGKKEELFKEVAMESEEFNKRFKVYAQNEHDAFYIITPQLMERIQRLDDKNKGKLLFCFIDNRLHIGIYDNKNSFEPGSVFKEINEDTLKKITEEIETITQFVDELNLDNTLFKREV